MQHFANFNAPASLAEKEGREVCGFHFADFKLGDTELGNLNRLEYEKAKKSGDRTQYNRLKAQQKQTYDANRVAPNQNAQAAAQAKIAAAKEAKRVGNLGVGGKAKYFGGKALGVAGKLGSAALTASYILPSVLSMLPQKQQQEEEQY